MLVKDLSHIEVVAEENQIQGSGGYGYGYYYYTPKFAYADAYADAKAKGKYFAATYTDTYTSAKTDYYGATAKSGSYSSSAAS